MINFEKTLNVSLQISLDEELLKANLIDYIKEEELELKKIPYEDFSNSVRNKTFILEDCENIEKYPDLLVDYEPIRSLCEELDEAEEKIMKEIYDKYIKR